MKNRIISVALAAALLTSASAYLPVSDAAGVMQIAAHAEESYDLNSAFSSAEGYTAACIQKGYISPVTGEQDDYALYSQLLNRDFGYEEIARSIAKEKKLSAISAFWTLTEAIGENAPAGWKALSETELYMLFLTDYLTYTSASAAYENDLEMKSIQYFRVLCQKAEDTVQSNDTKPTDIWEALSLEDARSIAANADFCKNTQEKYTAAAGEMDAGCTTALDYFKAAARAAALAETDKNRVNYLLKIKEQAKGNEAFCAAVDSIIAALNEAPALIGMDALGKTAGAFAVKHVWSKLSAAITGMTDIAKPADGIALLFHTDDAAVNSIRILLMDTCKLCAQSALMQSYKGYNAKKAETVSAFNADFLAYLSYQDYASEMSKSFVTDALVKAWLLQIKSTFSDKNQLSGSYWDTRFSADNAFCKRAGDMLQKFNQIYYSTTKQPADALISDALTSETGESSIMDDLNSLRKPEYYTNSITSALTLNEDTVFEGNVIIKANVNLNGHTMTVNGDIVHSSGTITMNGGRLNVSGSYYDYNRSTNEETLGYENSSGKIIMNQESDYFFVQNNIVTMLTNAAQPSITKGTVELMGNFFNLDDDFQGDTSTWIGTGSSSLLLTGTSDQHLCFERYRVDGTTHFTNVTVKNADSRTIWIDKTFSIKNLYSDAESVHLAANNEVFTPLLAHMKLFCNLDLTGNYKIGRNYSNTEDGINWISDEVIDLNGHQMSVDGTVYHFGGTISFNQGGLAISGNYISQLENKNEETNEVTYDKANGILKMSNAEDTLKIGGDMVMRLKNKEKISAGTIEVGGNILNDGDCPFFMTGTSKMILTGEKDQELHFDYYWTESDSHINNLFVQNASSRKLLISDILEINNLNCDGNCVTFVSRNGSLGTLGIYCLEVKVEGDLAETKGTINLNGNSLTVDGNFTQKYGTLNLNGGSMTVQGDYNAFIQKTDSETGEETKSPSEGIITMADKADHLLITGDFNSEFKSKQKITEGTVELKGNLHNNGENCVQFEKNSKLLLSGEGEQTLEIAYYYSDDAVYHVNAAEIDNTAKERAVNLTDDTEIKTVVLRGTKPVTVNNPTSKATLKYWTVPAGSSVMLKGVLGEIADVEKAVFTSSAPEIVETAGASLRFMQAGTCAVTVTDENGNSVALNVTVTENAAATSTIGDVNGDGSINLKDVVMLRRAIAGGWNMTVDEKNADINKDGSINLKDVVILRRYIAGGWGVQLGS